MAAAMLRLDVGLIYGGAQIGLMGVVADAVLAGGGKVIGVIPEPLMQAEVAHQGLTSLEVVPSMHHRKARMIELADAMVALPGGLGTLEEMFEALQHLKNWKPHRQTEMPEINREEFLEEIVDAFNYFLSLIILIGVDVDEFYDAFLKKDEIIRSRLKEGY